MADIFKSCVMAASCVTALAASPAYADPLNAAGYFFFTTMQPRFGGITHQYERSGNVFTTSHTDEKGTFTQRLTRINDCTYRFEFDRPPNIATPSSAMEIDFSGYRRSNMSQAVAGGDGRGRGASIKFTGIRACNVGQNEEVWNPHIRPGTCASTFYRRISTTTPELQRAGLNEMIAACQRRS